MDHNDQRALHPLSEKLGVQIYLEQTNPTINSPPPRKITPKKRNIFLSIIRLLSRAKE